MRGPVSRQRAWQRRNPAKALAHGLVAFAEQAGQLVRPVSCEACGTATRLHGHHDDYSKPLAVRWLCPACHGKAHTRARWGGPIFSTSIRLEPEQLEAVRTLARREKRSLGNTIRVLIDEALAARSGTQAQVAA